MRASGPGGKMAGLGKMAGASGKAGSASVNRQEGGLAACLAAAGLKHRSGLNIGRRIAAVAAR